MSVKYQDGEPFRIQVLSHLRLRQYTKTSPLSTGIKWIWKIPKTDVWHQQSAQSAKALESLEMMSAIRQILLGHGGMM